MNRKEFTWMTQPLTQKLYALAFGLLPDDLQAEQLVIDSVNAYLLKERRNVLKIEVDFENNRDVLLTRKKILKGIIRHMSDIGYRRSAQLTMEPQGRFKTFYQLDPKIRLILKMRFETQLSVEDIEEVLQMPRFEVIEKIHNGRFLLMSEQGMAL